MNKAFNAFVWNRCPKNIFVGKPAVVAFNDGASGVIDIMSKVGIHAGFWNLDSSRHADFIRISGANYKLMEVVKKRRKCLHATKKGYDKGSDKALN